MPVFLLGGLTGAFFRPLAVSYTLAIVASMVVALTVTPALALILLRNGPDRAPRVARRPVAAGRVHATAVRHRLDGRSARTRLSWCSRSSGWRSRLRLGQSLFPTFKERDFLVHWVA